MIQTRTQGILLHHGDIPSAISPFSWYRLLFCSFLPSKQTAKRTFHYQPAPWQPQVCLTWCVSWCWKNCENQYQMVRESMPKIVLLLMQNWHWLLVPSKGTFTHFCCNIWWKKDQEHMSRSWRGTLAGNFFAYFCWCHVIPNWVGAPQEEGIHVSSSMIPRSARRPKRKKKKKN